MQFGQYHFVQISLACGINIFKEYMERLKTSIVSITNGSTEEFYWQIYCKKLFSDRTFYVIIADTDIGSLKSLHILFDKCLGHMLVKFKQNLMV